MLSAGAFNALLKTLEEPPEYVVIYFGNDRGTQNTDYDHIALSAIQV